mgnify:CR=1 FL=1
MKTLFYTDSEKVEDGGTCYIAGYKSPFTATNRYDGSGWRYFKNPRIRGNGIWLSPQTVLVPPRTKAENKIVGAIA